MATKDQVITSRQRQTLEIIYRSLRDFGYPPTLAELKESLKVKSNQAVLDFLKILENKKLIKRNEGAARGLILLKKGFEVLKQQFLLPIAGTSYAGAMTETVEATDNWRSSSGNVRIDEETFLIEISGDSMIGAGINDGDHLVAKPSTEFVNCDIVLARVGDQTTVKRLVTQNHPPYVFLKPENPKYDIILFTEGMKMEAKIVGKYQQDKITPIDPKTKSFIG